MTAQRYQAIFDWFRARPAALRALGYAQKISVLEYLVHARGAGCYALAAQWRARARRRLRRRRTFWARCCCGH